MDYEASMLLRQTSLVHINNTDKYMYSAFVFEENINLNEMQLTSALLFHFISTKKSVTMFFTHFGAVTSRGATAILW